MSPQLRGEIRQEADLIARFAQTYRRQFSELIDRMNRANARNIAPGSEASPDPASLRLCIEAVDMMLLTQQHLAKALDAISADLGLRNAA